LTVPDPGEGECAGVGVGEGVEGLVGVGEWDVFLTGRGDGNGEVTGDGVCDGDGVLTGETDRDFAGNGEGDFGRGEEGEWWGLGDGETWGGLGEGVNLITGGLEKEGGGVTSLGGGGGVGVWGRGGGWGVRTGGSSITSIFSTGGSSGNKGSVTFSGDFFFFSEDTFFRYSCNFSFGFSGNFSRVGVGILGWGTGEGSFLGTTGETGCWTTGIGGVFTLSEIELCSFLMESFLEFPFDSFLLDLVLGVDLGDAAPFSWLGGMGGRGLITLKH